MIFFFYFSFTEYYAKEISNFKHTYYFSIKEYDTVMGSMVGSFNVNGFPCIQ